MVPILLMSHNYIGYFLKNRIEKLKNIKHIRNVTDIRISHSTDDNYFGNNSLTKELL